MREIKFRAWDKKRGHFHWGIGNICLTLGGNLMWQFGYNAPDILGKEEADDYVLQQYTGLKDKNGKESYFDDVLKWRNSTFRIIWDDECACVMLKRLTGTDGMSEIPAHNIKDSEVIGNIYENPELLGVDNG